MKVKRYIGETVQEAMQKVKMDLGRDAIIISTRKVKKRGIVGLFTRPLIEVIATIDTYDKSDEKVFNTETTIKTEQNSVNYISENSIERQAKNAFSEANISIKNMESEFGELKTMINKVYNTLKDEDEKFSELVKEYEKMK